ncbi:DinB family protein [Blastococcus sp. CT_GayMR16]|uniref:DinB family protein n=1 Tax=Blastococcus sp. CT_GayMR16 TaxID=2559607 RepID=UPI001072FC9D|nr:DinB family protein [Blastococcus sp. CT_GayMR16]TFV89964.1 DinB family protein [Blastococcus sp. CT_GayMR16]
MRIDPPDSGPELDQLTSFLDLQRATVLWKTEGLTREQLAQPHPPSTLTLGGLLNHLALVEDSWFRVRFVGLPDDELWAGIDWDADPDFEFRTAAEVEPEELRRRYEEACARSREVVAGADSLDQLSVERRRTGQQFDLRWMLLHMIEETARHAGHADLLREAIDGATGQ